MRNIWNEGPEKRKKDLLTRLTGRSFCLRKLVQPMQHLLLVACKGFEINRVISRIDRHIRIERFPPELQPTRLPNETSSAHA